MSLPKILLVDDSDDIFTMISALLINEAALTWAKDLTEAKKVLLEKKRFDLIVLDVNLPDGNGVEFLGSVLQEDMNVVLLTAHDSLNTRVKGFTFGAEDFITKPFDPAEFQARIRSKLKKIARRNTAASGKQDTASILKIVNLELDLEKQKAFDLKEFRESGKKRELDLTPVEFRLLLLFAKSNGEPVPRQAILSHVWGENVHVSPRVVDHHVCAVRKKIAEAGATIESVYGVGYKLDAA